MNKALLHLAVLSVMGLAHAEDPIIPKENENRDDSVLETITVTTTLHDQATAPASVTVIGAEELTAGNVKTISDILRTVAGVDTLSKTGRDEYQIRGMSGKYTLILVDGKRVSSKNALWRGSNFDNMPVALAKINRVEVIRGPMSTLYGSDAVGGVVNIITKAPDDTLSGTIEMGVSMASDLQGGDGRHFSTHLDLPITDTVFASVSASADDQSEWNDGKPSSKAIIEGKNTKEIGVSIDWQVTELQQLEFQADFSHDSRDKSLYRVLKRGKKVLPLYREQEATRTRLGVMHTGEWSWGDTTTFISYEKTNIDDFNTAYSRISPPALHEISEENLHVKSYANIDSFSNHLLTVGTEYLKTDVSDPTSYKKTGKGSSDNFALFAQDEISVTDSLSLTLGGRFDEHDVFGGYFSPKAYAVFKANDNITLKGGIGTAFKAPGMYQLNSEYTIVSCGGKCTISGDSNLKPETSTTTELGLVADYDNWLASATVFHTQAKDLIDAPLVKTPKGFKRQWKNLSSVELSGAELTSSVNVSDDLTVSGNYTYLHAEDGEGNLLTNRNRHQLFAKLNYDMTENLSAFVSAEHESGKRVQVGKVQQRYPSVTKFNLGANWQYESLQLNLGVDNVGDVRLHEKTPSVFSAPGRVYYARLRYDF